MRSPDIQVIHYVDAWQREQAFSWITCAGDTALSPFEYRVSSIKYQLSNIEVNDRHICNSTVQVEGERRLAGCSSWKFASRLSIGYSYLFRAYHPLWSNIRHAGPSCVVSKQASTTSSHLEAAAMCPGVPLSTRQHTDQCCGAPKNRQAEGVRLLSSCRGDLLDEDFQLSQRYPNVQMD